MSRIFSSYFAIRQFSNFTTKFKQFGGNEISPFMKVIKEKELITNQYHPQGNIGHITENLSKSRSNPRQKKKKSTKKKSITPPIAELAFITNEFEPLAKVLARQEVEKKMVAIQVEELITDQYHPEGNIGHITENVRDLIIKPNWEGHIARRQRNFSKKLKKSISKPLPEKDDSIMSYRMIKGKLVQVSGPILGY